MIIYSVPYGFVQRFRVAAPEAFAWCVDYDPGDLTLMGERGKRKIQRISKNTVLLTDSFPKFMKKKLVHIYPEKRFWTAVHVAGPIKYSQFLYQIVEEGNNSSLLEFTGFQLNQDESLPTQREISSIANRLEREDSAAWRKLAMQMEKELA
jgi:hypothetical protein